MPEIRLPRIRLIRVASSPGKPPMSGEDFIKEDLHQPNELTADTEELKIETPWRATDEVLLQQRT